MPNKTTTQILKEKIQYLFRNGGVNSPHTSLHIQYSSSKYANRITEDVINELITEALSQQQQEDYQCFLDLIGEDQPLTEAEMNDAESRSPMLQFNRGYNLRAKELRKAIAEKRGKV